jgi:hypothetical protein
MRVKDDDVKRHRRPTCALLFPRIGVPVVHDIDMNFDVSRQALAASQDTVRPKDKFGPRRRAKQKEQMVVPVQVGGT